MTGLNEMVKYISATIIAKLRGFKFCLID